MAKSKNKKSQKNLALKALRDEEIAKLPSNVDTTKTLGEILSNHDLVEVVPNGGDPFIIVSERPSRQLGESVESRSSDVVNLMEIGTSSPSPFTSFIRREYNRDLIGIKGLEKYDQMRRSDGTVRGTLRAMKTPVLAARWFTVPKDNKKVADKNAAEFLWKNLTEYMTTGFMQTLTEMLLMCDFGYYMFEIVWEDTVFEGQERIMVKKLAPRHPMDVKTWHYDANGGPDGVTMYSPTGNVIDEPFIPIDKLIVFTFDREAGNIEGISVLRSAYKHWYFKDQLYKIDAIQKERHGIGVPIIKLPPGFSKDDKEMANNMGRNLRSNERAHIVIPPNWEIMFAKLEGHVVDALASIKVHDDAIRENILATFLGSANNTKEEDQTMFLKATRFIADIICEVINTHLYPKMMEANFARVGTPKLKARRIGEQADWRTLSFAIRNLIGAGALRPDDPLEAMLRDEMDLPEADLKTMRPTGNVRETVQAIPGKGGSLEANPADTQVKPASTKQRPDKAGLPRQAALPPAKQAKNSGIDNSGGK